MPCTQDMAVDAISALSLWESQIILASGAIFQEWNFGHYDWGRWKAGS